MKADVKQAGAEASKEDLKSMDAILKYTKDRIKLNLFEEVWLS
jgi:hypothetical protein